MMPAQQTQHDRFGVVIAAALGLLTSSYFELEARGVLPNPLEPRFRLLAGVFSERTQEHASMIAEPWARALAFALALAVGVAAWRDDLGTTRLFRLAYALGTLVLPTAAMLLTLLAQPVAFGELCAPCLLESLFALAILECRSPAPAPISRALETWARDGARWRNRYSSPPST
jgi:hypothetical protein